MYKFTAELKYKLKGVDLMDEDANIYGLSINDITFNFIKLDTILKLEKIKLEICLIGGTACLLTGLINRATIDYDLLNLDYSPKVRNYLNFFNPYDLVDFDATTIPRSFVERMNTVFKGDYLECKVLSLEDLVLSKLCRNLGKDFKDIDFLLIKADKTKVLSLIEEVWEDIHSRYPRLQENFKFSLITFSQRYQIELILTERNK